MYWHDHAIPLSVPSIGLSFLWVQTPDARRGPRTHSVASTDIYAESGADVSSARGYPDASAGTHASARSRGNCLSYKTSFHPD